MPVLHPRPERRFEIFLSSTFEDLKDVRFKLAEATVRCGHFPIGMELFSAGPRDVDHIKQCISEADIFVILVGARYGSFVKKVGDHFLDFEYRIASDLKKPILAYVLEDPEYEQFRSSLKEGDPERTYDTELRTFRNQVKQDADGYGRLIDFFSLKGDRREELINKYERALGKLAGGMNVGGWVRAERYDELHSRVTLSHIVSRNPFFSDFVKRLDKFDTLSLRIADEVPDLKTAIARYFLDQYLGLLISSGAKTFFFESGSSIAFLSKEFIAYLHDEKWVQEVAGELLIHTNNIITYLDFGLSERIRVELYPYGPPEKKYGATFGALTSLTKLPPSKVRELLEHRSSTPKRSGGDYSDPWQIEVENLATWFRRGYERNGVILMTASGLETDPQHPYHGPHVGSYYNMLFKRSILKSRCPVVMFLDEGKVLAKPFDDDFCFPVCDAIDSWQSVCSEVPLALAVPCRTEQALQDVTRILVALGLTFQERRKEEGVHLLIASNEKFHRWSSEVRHITR